MAARREYRSLTLHVSVANWQQPVLAVSLEKSRSDMLTGTVLSSCNCTSNRVHFLDVSRSSKRCTACDCSLYVYMEIRAAERVDMRGTICVWTVQPFVDIDV